MAKHGIFFKQYDTSLSVAASMNPKRNNGRAAYFTLKQNSLETETKNTKARDALVDVQHTYYNGDSNGYNFETYCTTFVKGYAKLSLAGETC